MMAITRRTFLKIAAGVAGMVATGGFAIGNYIKKGQNVIAGARKTRGLCPICPAHCSLHAYHKNGELVYAAALAKDRSSSSMLCTKGILLPFRKKNRDLLEDNLYVKSASVNRVSYAAAIEMAADALRRLRDESYVRKNGDAVINGTDAIVVLGGDSLTNEEAYQCAKFARTLGVREVCADSALHERAAAADIETFGIAAQHNPIYDIENSNAILVIASNPARSCTAIAGHMMRAQKRGAAIIVVDPIKSESASVADIHLQIRPKTDPVLLAGMINYLLRNAKLDTDYLADNTDAGYIISDEFSFTPGARFSGFDPKQNRYADTHSWSYVIDERGNPRTDRRLTRPNCVLSHLKNYYAPFTPDFVVRETGVNGPDFLKACGLFCDTAKKDSSGAVVYGSPLAGSFEGVRLVNILQLLCANIGFIGGGILNASASLNHQGLLDQMSADCLPGYIPLPSENDTYETWVRENAYQVNIQESRNLRKDLVTQFTAMAKAWYGQDSPEKAFSLLPRRPSQPLTAQLYEAILGGAVRALLLFESDFLDSLSSQKASALLEKLDLLIICTSTDRARRAVRYMPVKGECFVFPVIGISDKRGTVTSPDRRVAKINAAPVSGLRHSPLDVITDLFRSVRSLYKVDGGAYPEPLLLPVSPSASVRKVADELYGSDPAICGNWLYSAALGRSYKTSPSAQQLRLWGDPWLYASCAYNPDRSERSERLAPKLMPQSDEAWTLPFVFIPEGRARLFSRIVSPFPELDLSAAAVAAQPALVSDGIERMAVFARSCELRYLAINDAYNAFFAGEGLVVSKATAAQIGIISGKDVRVLVDSLGEDRVMSMRLSEQVPDDCAVICSRFMQPQTSVMKPIKVKIMKVL